MLLAIKVLLPPTIIANHSNAVIGEGRMTNVFIDDTLYLHCLIRVDADQRVDLRWSIKVGSISCRLTLKMKVK